MIRLLIIILISAQAFSQDFYRRSSEEFEDERDKFNQKNDCSIIAYSKAFDVFYEDAMNLFKPYKSESGVKLVDFLRVISKELDTIKMMDVNKQTFLEVKKNLPRGDYFVVTKGHIFYIENIKNSGRYWIWSEEGDEKREILTLIRIR